MTLYLSRLTLLRKPGVDALSGLINPQGPESLDAHHQLIWSLFADGPDRKRDFLWREDRRGRFYTLSQRRPDPSGMGLFATPETKSFEPDLRPGDRLRFSLRANATQNLPSESRKDRGKRVDVVMHALLTAEKEDGTATRASLRDNAAMSAGRKWLTGQGKKHGFRPVTNADGEPSIVAESYRTMESAGRRGKEQGRLRFGIVDLSGEIEVLDPNLFLPQLARGFGRAKAFGCGLMLIRRA